MSGKSSSTKPAPGSSFAAAGKQYSQESSKALRKLNSIDKKFEGMVDRVDKVAQDTKYDEKEGVVPLLKAKNELAQIVGDLERLQFKEVRISIQSIMTICFCTAHNRFCNRLSNAWSYFLLINTC